MATTPTKPAKPVAKRAGTAAPAATPAKAQRSPQSATAGRTGNLTAKTPEQAAQAIDQALQGKLDNVQEHKAKKAAAKINNDVKASIKEVKKGIVKSGVKTQNAAKSVKSASTKAKGPGKAAKSTAAESDPSSFTQQIGDLICEALAEGHSLRTICKADNFPSKTTVFRWLADERYKAFRDQYARAREAQGDCLFDDMLDIADDGSNDTYVDDEGNSKTDFDVIARSKLRIETRKWMAGKLRPKVYGDKVDLNHGIQPENPIASLMGQLVGKNFKPVE